jgi:hypothetical protein
LKNILPTTEQINCLIAPNKLFGIKGKQKASKLNKTYRDVITEQLFTFDGTS